MKFGLYRFWLITAASSGHEEQQFLRVIDIAYMKYWLLYCIVLQIRKLNGSFLRASTQGLRCF